MKVIEDDDKDGEGKGWRKKERKEGKVLSAIKQNPQIMYGLSQPHHFLA